LDIGVQTRSGTKSETVGCFDQRRFAPGRWSRPEGLIIDKAAVVLGPFSPERTKRYRAVALFEHDAFENLDRGSVFVEWLRKWEPENWEITLLLPESSNSTRDCVA
jgi:hypothetical protein